jgi:hypothetical protein
VSFGLHKKTKISLRFGHDCHSPSAVADVSQHCACARRANHKYEPNRVIVRSQKSTFTNIKSNCGIQHRSCVELTLISGCERYDCSVLTSAHLIGHTIRVLWVGEGFTPALNQKKEDVKKRIPHVKHATVLGRKKG